MADSYTLVAPEIGLWQQDPGTKEWLYTFKCNCRSDCKDVFVIRSSHNFGLTVRELNLDQIGKLQIRAAKSNIYIRIDPALSATAALREERTHFEQFGRLHQLNKTIRRFNDKCI